MHFYIGTYKYLIFIIISIYLKINYFVFPIYTGEKDHKRYKMQQPLVACCINNVVQYKLNSSVDNFAKCTLFTKEYCIK